MRERTGLLLSSTFHAAILAYAFIGLGSAKPFEVGPTEALPIEILTPQEFDAMTKGSKTSKKVDSPKQKAEQLASADSDPVDDDLPVTKEDVKAPPPPPPAAEAPPPKAEPTQDTAKAEAEKAAKAEAARAEKAEKAAKAEAAKAQAAEAAAAKAEAAKAEAAKAEAAKVAQERAEKIAEAADAERRAKAAEEEKVAKAAADKAAADKAAKEKADKIAKAEADKAAKEKAEAEKAAKLAQEKADKEKLEKIAKAEAEKAEKLAKAEADKVAKADAAAKAAKEKADAEKAAKAAERKFDPSKIASLLGDKASSSDSAMKDVRDPGRKAASGRQLAPETTAGTSRGTATKLSMSQRVGIDNAVREQISQCWNPPVGAGGDNNIVRVKFTLNADGSLSDGPTVDAGGAPRAFADAAARAVRRCAPLKLPADAYDYWRQVDIRFDPKDMMGG